MGMRVVAGEARGRLLRAPAGRTTRPTADRVREAVFSMLGAVVDLDGAVVVDLFAGSGALGIEALSRGSAFATFVESDPSALQAIRANLGGLGFGPDRAAVVRGDAVAWAGQNGVPAPTAGGWLLDSAGVHGAAIRVVLADPPYAFDRWPRLLAAIRSWADVAVLETGADLDLGPQWTAVRRRRYGATVVTIARPALSSVAATQPKGGM